MDAKIKALPVARAVPFDNSLSGLTSSEVQSGLEEVDNEINITNIVWVKQNPGHKDFSSVTAALASITTNSSSNPFVIKVGPMVVTDSQIVMKPYVYIEGSGEQVTVLQPSNPNQNFVIMCENSCIRKCLITGVTGSGFAALYMSSTTGSDQAPAFIESCRLGHNDTLAIVSAQNVNNSLFFDNCEIGGTFQFNNGFKATTTGAGVGKIVLKNCSTMSMTAALPNYVAYATGTNCELLIIGCSFRTGGVSSGSCVQADSGALVRILSLNIKGYAKGLWIQNVGSASTMYADAVNCENNTQDIQIDHSTAVGNIIGIANIQKVTNNSITLGILIVDSATGVSSVRGLRTKLDNTVTSASTLTLVGGSAMVQNFTGSTSGQIMQLPDATTLSNGHRYEFWNNSTTIITLKDGSSTNILNISQNSIVRMVLKDNSTSAGGWLIEQTTISTSGTVVNYNIISTTPFSTSSATDVVITGMTITPQAGTYAIWISGEWQDSNASAVMRATIYNNGVAVSDSIRTYQSFGAAKSGPVYTQTISQVNGSQAIDFRINTSSGTLTVNARSLLLIRLGP